jgi:hypothetical protein
VELFVVRNFVGLSLQGENLRQQCAPHCCRNELRA